MERLPFFCAAVGMIVLGGLMVIRPDWILRMEGGEPDRCPPTAGQTWRMRCLGVTIVGAGVFFLYALVTRMPGAEFSPA